MYDKLTIVDDMIDEAKLIVKKSRQKYDSVMKIIEEYIAANDIIVKNNDLYFYELYTTDMFHLPKELTDIIYNHNKSLYVVLTIKIYKYHSRIAIDGITFIHFTYINQEIFDNVIKYTRQGFFTNKKYRIFGPEIELINLYADIINPLHIDKWIDLYNLERVLISDISKNLKTRIFEGGSGHELINKTIDQVFKEFVSPRHVIIGQLAVLAYQNIKVNYITKIQLITENPLHDELKRLKVLFPKLDYSINNLKIPTNLNLYKLTCSLKIDNIKKIFIEIYDAGNHEIIAFTTLKIRSSIYIPNNLQIGSLFVIKRFKLIDIWYTLYLTNIKILNNTDYLISNLIDELLEMDSIKNNMFPVTYIGKLEDTILIKERIAVKLKSNYIPPYTPNSVQTL
jgi:hypothetical protein